MSGSHRRAVINVVRPAPDGGSQSEATLRGLCREALALTSALEAECWISSLLGQLWEQREQAAPLELDRAFVLGAPFVEQLARSGVPGARLALQSIAWIDRGGLGARCAQLADGLTREALPGWARGRRPVVVRRALSAGREGEGEILCLDVDGGGRIAHTLAVFVDARQAGVAKHIHVLTPIDEWAQEAFGAGGTLGAEGVEVALPAAGDRVIAAIARTETSPDAVVSESFADLRALALARAHACRRGPDGPAWMN